MLKQRGVKHEVLNAKFHEKEAQIVAQAGRKGAVTIATNMAGRGTDILLGGNAEFMAKGGDAAHGLYRGAAGGVHRLQPHRGRGDLKSPGDLRRAEQKIQRRDRPEAQLVRELGGLYIIGTERHESRRIDNQLGAAPAARATRAKAGSTSPWRTT